MKFNNIILNFDYYTLQKPYTDKPNNYNTFATYIHNYYITTIIDLLYILCRHSGIYCPLYMYTVENFIIHTHTKMLILK